MNYTIIALIILAIGLFTLQSLQLKKVSFLPLSSYLRFLSGVSVLICFVFSGAFLTLRDFPTVATLGYGALSGISFATAVSCTGLAMGYGPLSFTAFLVNTSLLIPVLYGVIFWQEPLTLFKIIGIALLLLAFFLLFLSNREGSGESSMSLRWLVLCFLAWCANGVTGLFQKQQQSVEQGAHAIPMTAISFLTAGILTFIVSVFLKNKRDTNDTDKTQGTSLAPRGMSTSSYIFTLLLTAMSTGGGNFLVTHLAGVMDASYLFPVILGGNTLTVSAYSLIVYQEKITLLGILSLGLGMASLFFYPQDRR